MSLLIVSLLVIVLETNAIRFYACGNCLCDYETDMTMTCEGFAVTVYPQLTALEKMNLKEMRLYGTLLSSLPTMLPTEYLSLNLVHIRGNIILPCYYVEEWRQALYGSVDFDSDCPSSSLAVSSSSSTISNSTRNTVTLSTTDYVSLIPTQQTTEEEEEEEEEIAEQAINTLLVITTCFTVLFLIVLLTFCILTTKKMRAADGGERNCTNVCGVRLRRLKRRSRDVNGSTSMYRESEGYYFENPVFMDNMDSSSSRV